MAPNLTSFCDRLLNAVILWAFIAVHAVRLPRFHDAVAWLGRAVEMIGGQPIH